MVDEPVTVAEITDQDRRQRHCPMLGHGVSFSYCRMPGDACPCRKIFDCWFEAFDVEGFLRAHYSEAQIEQITAPKVDRLATVLAAAARATRKLD
ncbi:MAG: hypothetical protein JRI68_23185 [Deltaproteobacteria bacterium]|nr:hypothetical protein [Deltaproteobacteria bacterium]